jgi:hypothetical protein
MSYETKVCFRCEDEKALDEFYRAPGMADGHAGKCKECTKTENRANRAQKVEQYRAYDRQRGSRPERKQQAAEHTIRWRQQNPEKAAAHRAVRRALRAGELQKQPCEVCEAADVHAHHDNYGQPLQVRWLCPLHHVAHHQEVNDVERHAA